MRISFLHIILLGLTLSFCSCVGDEKSLFDTSAAERLNQAMTNYRSALQNSSYGWAMDYYPSDGSRGGRVYTARFDATGAVKMCSEMDIAATATTPAISAGTEVQSLYQVLSEQSVILTFDTYNQMFHYWSEPIATWDPDGYASDYEFIFQQMSEKKDTISLKGRKYGNILNMYKLTIPATDYVKKAIAQKTMLANTPRYRMTVKGKDYLINFNTVTRQFSYITSGDSTHNAPFIPTATGFRLYHPITIDGISAQSFNYDEKEGSLSSTDKQMVLPSPSAIERFCATNGKWHYIFNFTDSTAEMNGALFSLLKEANAKDIETTKGTITDFYIGKIRLGQPTSLIWKSNDKERPYECSYLTTLRIVDNAKHLISITPTEKGTFFTTYSFLQTIVDYLAKASPYTIEFDNDTLPTKARLVSAANSEIWFNLSFY